MISLTKCDFNSNRDFAVRSVHKVVTHKEECICKFVIVVMKCVFKVAKGASFIVMKCICKILIVFVKQ